MKKLLLTMGLLAGATAGYAQGTINWGDYVSGTFSITIFGPPTPTSAPSNLGNTANDFPAGTASYAGAPLAGSGYEIGLYIGSSAAAVSTAVATGTPLVTDTFETSASGLAGTWVGSTEGSLASAVDPNGNGKTSVFVELAAWSSSASSYAVASATPGDVYGKTGPSTSAITEGGPAAPLPPTITPTLEGIGLMDFSVGSVPEPSTIALGVVGASAFLMRLRRKQ